MKDCLGLKLITCPCKISFCFLPVGSATKAIKNQVNLSNHGLRPTARLKRSSSMPAFKSFNPFFRNHLVCTSFQPFLGKSCCLSVSSKRTTTDCFMMNSFRGKFFLPSHIHVTDRPASKPAKPDTFLITHILSPLICTPHVVYFLIFVS